MSQSDGRVAIFRLTRKGRRLFAEIAQRHRIWVAEAFSGLGAEQVATFRLLLEKLRLPAEFADGRRDAA
jgi:DNA-binding MarR family transcriptional regulator